MRCLPLDCILIDLALLGLQARPLQRKAEAVAAQLLGVQDVLLIPAGASWAELPVSTLNTVRLLSSWAAWSNQQSQAPGQAEELWHREKAAQQTRSPVPEVWRLVPSYAVVVLDSWNAKGVKRPLALGPAHGPQWWGQCICHSTADF